MQKRIKSRFSEKDLVFISKMDAAIAITREEYLDMERNPDKYSPLRPARRFKKKLKNIAENMAREAVKQVHAQKALAINEKRRINLSPFSKPLNAYVKRNRS